MTRESARSLALAGFLASLATGLFLLSRGRDHAPVTSRGGFFWREPIEATTLRFRIPPGRWGFFVVPENTVAPGETYVLRVPESGVCAAASLRGGYSYSAEFTDGKPIANRDEPDARGHHPLDTEVALEGVQQGHPKGSMFFIGTVAQYRAHFAEIGLFPRRPKPPPPKPWRIVDVP